MEEPGSAYNTLSSKWAETLRGDESRFDCKFQFAQCREVETLTLQDLISTYGEPAFVKIDVEEHELNVIRGMLNPVACLSFEVNLPEFREEGKKCVDLLTQVSENGIFNYAVDCQRGLALPEWLRADEFQSVIEECKEKSIEVFWRTATSEN